MVASVLRTRVERLLYGDFVADDLTRLFLYLRETSYGRQTVREIGDFVAHFGMRDKGPSTEKTNNFFTVLRFVAPFQAEGRHNINGLSVNRDLLIASFATIDPEFIREKTRIKPKVAKQVFDSLLQKFTEIAGKNERRQLTPDESALMTILVTTFTTRAAFDGETVTKEFMAVLQKNGLLEETEIEKFKQIAPVISLYAVSVMHQCNMKLKSGPPSFLLGDRANVEREIWPAPGSEDTELGVFMGPEVRHGETEVYTRVQA
jgi:hypothetical protein